mmetsp:Transcript_11631/g.43358  ORF Transcript_11631/g.43358 Transcript_11631/m.43358 type:complete len:299 (+) Transcript_11631:218-1114(+)
MLQHPVNVVPLGQEPRVGLVDHGWILGLDAPLLALQRTALLIAQHLPHIPVDALELSVQLQHVVPVSFSVGHFHHGRVSPRRAHHVRRLRPHEPLSKRIKHHLGLGVGGIAEAVVHLLRYVEQEALQQALIGLRRRLQAFFLHQRHQTLDGFRTEAVPPRQVSALEVLLHAAIVRGDERVVGIDVPAEALHSHRVEQLQRIVRTALRRRGPDHDVVRVGIQRFLPGLDTGLDAGGWVRWRFAAVRMEDGHRAIKAVLLGRHPYHLVHDPDVHAHVVLLEVLKHLQGALPVSVLDDHPE